MSSEEKSPPQQAMRPVGPQGLAMPTPQEEWQALGVAFEGLAKVGIALTVGFGVAATFCKLMESGKMKLPTGSIQQLTQQILLANMDAEEKPK